MDGNTGKVSNVNSASNNVPGNQVNNGNSGTGAASPYEKKGSRWLNARTAVVLIVIVIVVQLGVGAFFMFRNQGGMFVKSEGDVGEVSMLTGKDSDKVDRSLGELTEEQVKEENKKRENNAETIIKELDSYFQENRSYPQFLEVVKNKFTVDWVEIRVAYEYEVMPDLQDYKLCVRRLSQPVECYNREGVVVSR